MREPIDQIFDAYETGKLSRRGVLQAIASFLAIGGGAACAPASTPSAAPAAPDYSTLVTRRVPGAGRAHLNHVNLRVADVDRSFAFYQRHFGLGITTTPTYNALDCGGGTFISLQTRADIERETFRRSEGALLWARTLEQSPGMIEHFCLEVDDFDLEKTRESLRAEGREVVEISENLLTSDPDGVLVQVVDSKLRFLHEE